MKVLLVGSLAAILMLSGCATDGNIAPPTPAEAKLIATSVMRLASTGSKLRPDQLQKLRVILADSKSILMTALRENPKNLSVVTSQYLASKESVYAELANTVLGVLVVRLRPAIDQGKTELAGQYIEAVIAGAILAIDIQLAPPEVTLLDQLLG